ncbi:hypothetical protein EVA_21746 [gut metagenome]|uniref:Uncharacterized protein n=1 Tax=gut metagenome TaxID=749906 RepID=J9FS16_9ZZZZ
MCSSPCRTGYCSSFSSCCSCCSCCSWCCTVAACRDPKQKYLIRWNVRSFAMDRGMPRPYFMSVSIQSDLNERGSIYPSAD